MAQSRLGDGECPLVLTSDMTGEGEVCAGGEGRPTSVSDSDRAFEQRDRFVVLASEQQCTRLLALRH